MPNNEIRKVLHKRSGLLDGTNPKLPAANVMVEGEIAVNYHKGVETLSIKNSEGEIVAFQNEILLGSTPANGELSTAKLIIDEDAESAQAEIYTKAETDGRFSLLEVADEANKQAIEQKITCGESMDNSEEAFIFIDESETVVQSETVYTKKEVDDIIKRLKEENNLI